MQKLSFITGLYILLCNAGLMIVSELVKEYSVIILRKFFLLLKKKKENDDN